MAVNIKLIGSFQLKALLFHWNRATQFFFSFPFCNSWKVTLSFSPILGWQYLLYAFLKHSCAAFAFPHVQSWAYILILSLFLTIPSQILFLTKYITPHVCVYHRPSFRPEMWKTSLLIKTSLLSLFANRV